MREVFCDYCGKKTELVDSKEIYGKSYGDIYLCRPCNAYVGCHKGTDTPLGRLANAELREWKKRAHAKFDPKWRRGLMSRSKAYAVLSNKLGIHPDKCHIGMFDVDQCKRAVEVCLMKWEI